MRSPLRNIREIADYVRCIDPETGDLDLPQARQWVERHIPREKRKYRGCFVLVHIDDIDAALSARARKAS